jgi:hypothetical protein
MISQTIEAQRRGAPVGTVAVDFDGPIHRYSQGWNNGTIYDRPADGALDALDTLMGRSAVFVHTSRDPRQVVPWLRAHGLSATARMPTSPFWDDQRRLLVTNSKLPALAYVDDRAVRYESWPQTMAELAVILGRP